MDLETKKWAFDLAVSLVKTQAASLTSVPASTFLGASLKHTYEAIVALHEQVNGKKD